MDEPGAALVSIPTPWTVGYHARTAAAADPYREAAAFTPPADEEGEPVAVCGWYVPELDDPFVAGHPDRVSIAVVLFVPPGFDPADGSLIDLPAGPAGQFEVAGGARDYTHGPFGFAPGSAIALRKVGG